jgi:hypothetical protein
MASVAPRTRLIRTNRFICFPGGSAAALVASVTESRGSPQTRLRERQAMRPNEQVPVLVFFEDQRDGSLD